AVAEHQRAEPVPLGLEHPAVAVRQVGDPEGEHRRNRRFDALGHVRKLAQRAARSTRRNSRWPRNPPPQATLSSRDRRRVARRTVAIPGTPGDSAMGLFTKDIETLD